MDQYIKIVSSLEKIFPENNSDDFDSLYSFSMMKNEKKSFQIVLNAKIGDEVKIAINSELAKYIKTYYVKLIPCELAAPKISDDYYITKNGGLFPDLLSSIKNDSFTAEYNGQNSIWIEINPGDDILPTGTYVNTFEISVNENSFSASVNTEVIDISLPKQKLIFTNWFHTDCLMSYYKFKVFSDEYWQTVENFLRRANEYGMNCVLTPVFTPPLDTQVGKERPTVQLVKVFFDGKGNYEFDYTLLDKWIAMAKRCNIEYFEISHLFTQWGAKHAPKIIADVNGVEKQIFGWDTNASSKEYEDFIRQFSLSFCKYTKKNNLSKNIFIHVSDEPSFTMLSSYKKASKIVHKYFGQYKIIDAISSYPLSKICKIKYPIPANNMIKPFLGKVKEQWTYYCCCQANKNVSNRFFSMPSVRNRVLGFQMYKFDVKGFLHWGYNFYYTQYAKKLINPFEITDAGKAFSSGDSFVVYPGENGMPINSLRLNVFYDGFQDMMALELLESKIGKENVVKLLEQNTKRPITFSEYPHSAKWLLNTREEINSEIKMLI